MGEKIPIGNTIRTKPASRLKQIEAAISRCERCPRLRTYCAEIAAKKKREFRDWDYWGRPVPGFGDPRARLWIVGLAPAAHGANRTGRMFTGDSSGRWLYRALYRTGFANQESCETREDGLVLRDVYISSSARCAPPDNKPLPSELAQCRSYLEEEFDALSRKVLILALGGIAFTVVGRLLGSRGMALPRGARFSHGGWHEAGGLWVMTSYHPSRQNTQTGRMTEKMWESVFVRAREFLDATTR